MGAPVKVKGVMLKAHLLLALSLAAGWASADIDPTAPPRFKTDTGTESTPDAPVLAWVRVNGPQSIAWYGGTTVKLGDPVEGGRVTAIREDHIVISGKNGRRAVYLLDDSIRTKPRVHTRPPRQNRN